MSGESFEEQERQRELHQDVSGILRRDGRCLQEKRSGVCLGEYSHIDAAKKFSTSLWDSWHLFKGMRLSNRIYRSCTDLILLREGIMNNRFEGKGESGWKVCRRKLAICTYRALHILRRSFSLRP